MFRKVNIETNQKVTQKDFNDFGNHPREAMDFLVKDLGGYPAGRYVGFTVEQTGNSVVRAGAGRLYNANGVGFLFDAPSGESIDFLDFLPSVAKRIATIVVYGNTIDTDLEPRTYLSVPATGATASKDVATESRRQAYVSYVLGIENATPSPPAIAANYVAVAHVVLGPGGVESITQLTANRVVSTYRNAEDISLINSRLNAVGPQIDTLRTDISGLAASNRTKADAGLVHDIAIDMGRVKDILKLPDDYVTYGADRFLDESESDTAAAGYSCIVREGIRFPSANSNTVRLALENPVDPRVTVNDGMVLPKYTTTPRLSIVGNDGEYPLTNTTVETIQLREMKETRTVREFLGSQYWCSNTSWWNSGTYDPITGIFRRNGETFIISSNPLSQSSISTPQGNLAFTSVYANRYTERQVIDTHWENVSVQTNVSGSITAQSVLNSADGYLCETHFFVTKKATSGNIRVLLCEVNDAGEPMFNRVLAQTDVAHADIKVFPTPTKAVFKPTYLTRGKRTARVYISSSGHFLAVVNGNKLAQGAFMSVVDGHWQVSQTGQDLAIEDHFAVFLSPVTTVQLQPLELAGGIDSIRINCDDAMPEGTDIDFRVRVNNEWRSLKEGRQNVNFLSGLPSLTQFQAVLIGTTDVMPSFGVGETRSEVFLNRPATALTHVSTPRLLPSACTTVEIEERLENWDPANHSVTMTLLTGAGYSTVETADAVTNTPHPTDQNVMVKKAVFNVSPGITSFKLKTVGASGASAQRFHVGERTDIEFA